MIAQLIYYVLTAALRDKLLLSVFLMIIVGAALAQFVGGSAVVEQDYFSLVFAASGMRIAMILTLVLFVCFFIRRLFDSKDIEFLLSRPVGKLQLLGSFSFAFSLIAVLVCLAILPAFYLLSPSHFSLGYILWWFSVVVESVVMVNAAMFFALYMNSATTSALSSLSLYILGRMMGQILGIIYSDFGNMSGPMASSMKLVSTMVPRFDLMGQTQWLIYGADNGSWYFGFFALQGILYSFLLFMAASLDLWKRQF